MEDDWLTDDEELDGPTYKTELKVVTRSHFIDNHLRAKCTNPKCKVSFLFPSIRRRHHCRRCGEVFCRECLQYTRRLNAMAQPYAKGIPSRVCLECYVERDVVLEGVRRSNTLDFLDMRSDYLEARRKLVCDVTMEIKKADKIPTFWKEQFEVDILKECRRLLAGFEEGVGSSDTMKTVEEVRGVLTIPYWQKSTYWQLEKSTVSCRMCRKSIARINKKRYCRVCGLALCKKCSHKELLLYYDDDCKDRANTGSRLAIIRVDGCPEMEPRYSLLLHVCDDCRSYISDKQILDADWFIKKPKPPDVMSQFQAIDAIFRDLVTEINNKVSELEENAKSCKKEDVKLNRRSSAYGLVQSIHAIDKKRGLDTNKQSIMDDIQQKLCRYFALYTKLRNLRQEHIKASIGGSFSKLLSNYTKCRNDFYIKTKCTITSITKPADQLSTLKHL